MLRCFCQDELSARKPIRNIHFNKRYRRLCSYSDALRAVLFIDFYSLTRTLDFCLSNRYNYTVVIWKRIEVVITGRTRNAVVLFGLVGSNPTASARRELYEHTPKWVRTFPFI